MLISLTLLTTVLLHQNHLSSGSHLLPVDGNFHYWPFLRHHVHYAQQVYPVLVDGAPHEVRHSANVNEDALVANAKHELETVARLLGVRSWKLKKKSSKRLIFRNFVCNQLQSGARNMFASFRPSSFFSRTVSSSLSTMTTTSTSTVYCASGTHFVTSSPPFCPASVKRDVRAVESEFSVGQVAPSVTFLWVFGIFLNKKALVLLELFAG